MITVVIDAATYLGTTAVIRDGQVVAEGAAAMRGRDAEALMPTVAGALQNAGVAAHQLSRVVCGAGPGSFTSLRIAASIAKGLALGAGCPMFAVSSLALMIAGISLPAGRYLAVLDALRGDAYVGGYMVTEVGAVEVVLSERLVVQSEVGDLAATMSAETVGPGRTIDAAPHARGFLGLASLVEAVGPVDLGSWEPDYGRKAEAQVRWEAAHGRVLPVADSLFEQ
jgi:tRNA threonylcarbamoyladenosine biosynthesis protein TsaB